MGTPRLSGRDMPLLLTYFPRNDYGRALLLCHMKACVQNGDLHDRLSE